MIDSVLESIWDRTRRVRTLRRTPVSLRDAIAVAHGKPAIPGDVLPNPGFGQLNWTILPDEYLLDRLRKASHRLGTSSPLN